MAGAGMTWRYTEAGKEVRYPDPESGIHIDGPLTARDLRVIVADLLEALVDLAKKEANDEHA
jgi:hypothetical protein